MARHGWRFEVEKYDNHFHLYVIMNFLATPYITEHIAMFPKHTKCLLLFFIKTHL